LLNERQNAELLIIDDLGDISLQDLSIRFSDISVMTLRRDLAQLEQDGFILRTRGGAVSLKKLTVEAPSLSGEENEYAMRAHENMAAKKVIAEKALAFVKKGIPMYFDAGSTIMSLARILPDEQYNIITSGVNVAQEVVSHKKTTVMMPGGTVNKNTLSISGPDCISFIEKINIEVAFMSASAFSLDSGFMVSNMYEAQLKNRVIQKAKKSIILMDSTKIGKSFMFTLSGLEDIDILITDGNVPNELYSVAKELGVQIL